jgi:hypothetical protein
MRRTRDLGRAQSRAVVPATDPVFGSDVEVAGALEAGHDPVMRDALVIERRDDEGRFVSAASKRSRTLLLGATIARNQAASVPSKTSTAAPSRASSSTWPRVLVSARIRSFSGTPASMAAFTPFTDS